MSTEMATIKLVDWVNTSFEAGLIPAALFLDLKKAFDTIDHKQLLLELEKMVLPERVCLGLNLI